MMCRQAGALKSAAGAVVLKPGMQCGIPGSPSIAVLRQTSLSLWFARAAKLLKPKIECGWIHETAVIGEGAKLGSRRDRGRAQWSVEDAEIGDGNPHRAGAVIGEGVRIGEQCRIYPRVVVYPGTTMGNRVVVHAGVVLGADGFGYVRDPATPARTRSSRSRERW
jgi:UDP-3-O-[3-hydroxymyristoyl] glucosamine N-acyltransferase